MISPHGLMNEKNCGISDWIMGSAAKSGTSFYCAYIFQIIRDCQAQMPRNVLI